MHWVPVVVAEVRGWGQRQILLSLCSHSACPFDRKLLSFFLFFFFYSAFYQSCMLCNGCRKSSSIKINRHLHSSYVYTRSQARCNNDVWHHRGGVASNIAVMFTLGAMSHWHSWFPWQLCWSLSGGMTVSVYEIVFAEVIDHRSRVKMIHHRPTVYTYRPVMVS